MQIRYNCRLGIINVAQMSCDPEICRPRHCARQCCCQTTVQRCSITTLIYILFISAFFTWFGAQSAIFPWKAYITSSEVISTQIVAGVCPTWVNATAGSPCWNGEIIMLTKRGLCAPFYVGMSANRDGPSRTSINYQHVSLAVNLMYPPGRELYPIMISNSDASDCSLGDTRPEMINALLIWALIFISSFFAISILLAITCRYCSMANQSHDRFLNSLYVSLTPDDHPSMKRALKKQQTNLEFPEDQGILHGVI